MNVYLSIGEELSSSTGDRWLDDGTLDEALAAIRAGRELPVGRPDMAGPMGPLTASEGWERPHRPAGQPPIEAMPSRLMVITAIAIAAVLGAGALWLAPSNDPAALTAASSGMTTPAPAVAAPETTTPETRRTTNASTIDAPTTTESPYEGPELALVSAPCSASTCSMRSGRRRRCHRTVGFILGQPNNGVAAAWLWEQTADDFSSQYFDTRYQLWMEPGATLTSGRSIAISTKSSSGYGLDLSQNVQRIAGDG